jgi:general secretion pathway protein G
LSYRSEAPGRRERGFSLIEVVLVVLIMGILTSIAAQKWSGALEQSRFEATRAEMDRLAQAIVGNPDLTANGMRTSFGYVGDVGALPANLDALVSNPGLGTWKGPYIQNDFTQNPNDFKQDAWGTAYAYTGGVSITSNGSGAAVTKQFAGALSDLTSNSVSGSVSDGLDNPPGDSASAVTLRITYPNGTGGTASPTTHPSAGGSYSFAGSVPVGNHAVTAIYHSDTVVRYVSVLPKASTYVNFRLPGDLWSAGGGGGGGGGSGLAYVAGSAISYNSGKDFSFDVRNESGSTIAVTGIDATFAGAYYYEQIIFNGSTVFDSPSPRGSSGETRTFASQNVNAGQTITIRYNTFKLCVSGGCSNGDTRGASFTIDFSDGSSATFTVP